jgi:hypothetical protein
VPGGFVASSIREESSGWLDAYCNFFQYPSPCSTAFYKLKVLRAIRCLSATAASSRPHLSRFLHGCCITLVGKTSLVLMLQKHGRWSAFVFHIKDE